MGTLRQARARRTERPPTRAEAFRALQAAAQRAVDHLSGRGRWWLQDPETVKRDDLDTLGELQRALHKADRVKVNGR